MTDNTGEKLTRLFTLATALYDKPPGDLLLLITPAYKVAIQMAHGGEESAQGDSLNTAAHNLLLHLEAKILKRAQELEERSQYLTSLVKPP